MQKTNDYLPWWEGSALGVVDSGPPYRLIVTNETGSVVDDCDVIEINYKAFSKEKGIEDEKDS